MERTQLVSLLSTNARTIFNLSAAVIQEGENADLTFFSKTEITTMSQKDSKSKSANSPFWNLSLTGKVKGTFVKGASTLY